MNLQQLYYFRTLAEVKHFTKASIKLMVTQPSLSHSINDLEAELGVTLFDRSNRQVSLTKYGELFLEYVNRSLDILDEGRAKLSDFIDPDQGTVSLSYVSSSLIWLHDFTKRRMAFKLCFSSSSLQTPEYEII